MTTPEHVALFALLCEGVALGAVVLGLLLLYGWDRWQLVRGTKQIRR